MVCRPFAASSSERNAGAGMAGVPATALPDETEAPMVMNAPTIEETEDAL